MSALNPESIGTRIREVRGRLTQQQFADLLGVGRVSVARYETGARVPDAEFIQLLNAQLGVDPIWLLTGKGSSPADQAFVLRDGEATLLAGFRALDARGQAGVLAAIATMSQPDPSSKGRTKPPSQQQSIGVHVTQHAHGNDTTQVGSVKNLRIVRKSK